MVKMRSRARIMAGTDYRLAAQVAMQRLPTPAVALPPRPLSITEQLAQAPSPFALEMILRDALLFGWGDVKTRQRWGRAAYARDCELRGVLP